MSEPQASVSTSNAPAAESAAPTSAPASAKPSRSELLDKINAAIGKGTAAATAPESAPEAEASSDALQQPKAPDYGHKLAAAQLKAQKAESEALKHKAAVESVQKQLTELQALVDGAKADPVKALALANLDPAAFGQLMIEGKLTTEPAAPKAELPPEVQQLIEKAKAAEAREAQQAAEHAAAEIRTQNLQTIGKLVEQTAADYPLVASLPGVNERLLDAIEYHVSVHGSEPDFATVMKQAQDGVLREATAVFGNKAALAVILKDDAVKAAVLEALGLNNNPAEAKTSPPSKQTNSGNKPQTLTNKVTGAVPSRTTKGGNNADLAARINREILGRTA